MKIGTKNAGKGPSGQALILLRLSRATGCRKPSDLMSPVKTARYDWDEVLTDNVASTR